MKFDEYDGKTIFITGAAAGIGRAQAVAFLKNGANIFALDRHEQGLTEMAEEYKGRFGYVVGSVADRITVKRAVDEAIIRYTEIDILLNTAGILDDYKKTLDTDEALWDTVMNTNVKGTYLVTNAVLPHMLKQTAGVIVNMASIAGLVGGGGGAAYTASKHAIIGYTKQLSLDYAGQGIRVNAIAPGAIQTSMNKADFVGEGEMAKWVANETPAGRWAKPHEVADLTLFLASEAASYIHGSVMPIDGGWIVK